MGSVYSGLNAGGPLKLGCNGSFRATEKQWSQQEEGNMHSVLIHPLFRFTYKYTVNFVV